VRRFLSSEILTAAAFFHSCPQPSPWKARKFVGNGNGDGNGNGFFATDNMDIHG
jgi:hypothetical protein